MIWSSTEKCGTHENGARDFNSAWLLCQSLHQQETLCPFSNLSTYQCPPAARVTTETFSRVGSSAHRQQHGFISSCWKVSAVIGADGVLCIDLRLLPQLRLASFQHPSDTSPSSFLLFLANVLAWSLTNLFQLSQSSFYTGGELYARSCIPWQTKSLV